MIHRIDVIANDIYFHLQLCFLEYILRHSKKHDRTLV